MLPGEKAVDDWSPRIGAGVVWLQIPTTREEQFVMGPTGYMHYPLEHTTAGRDMSGAMRVEKIIEAAGQALGLAALHIKKLDIFFKVCWQ